MEFGGPAIYRIVVKGEVPAAWRDRLAGMSIDIINRPDGRHSVLEGKLQDQGDLNGVMESLYRLHLVILSVENLTKE